MKNMTPRNIAAACGGKPVNCGSILDTEVSAVTTDSRTVTPGCLYIPIKGETFDGHDFIGKAREAGALLVLTEKQDAAEDGPSVRVTDTRIAIQRIAEFYRKEMNIPVVGITGSVGRNHRLCRKDEHEGDDRFCPRRKVQDAQDAREFQ